MAENKKSFMLYTEWVETFSQLPNEKAGELIKLIFSYVNDEDPKCDDLLLNIAFTPIKQQLKRDLKKWESSIENKSDSGKLGNLKRWHLDIYNRVMSDEITLEEGLKLSQTIANDRTAINPIANIAVKDKVKVEVNVKDKVDKQPQKKYGEFKNVTLSKESINKLLKEFGKAKLLLIIEKLSSYKKATGKKYSSDIGAIRQWVIKSVNEEQPKAGEYVKGETMVIK